VSVAAISLTERMTQIEAGAHVTAAAFLGGAPTLALGNGVVVFGDQRLAAHPGGAILVARASEARLVTGGDDGRVVAIAADGAMTELAHEKGWIDALAIAPDGVIAFAIGKRVFVRDLAGATKTWTAPSGVRGLAFMPKGRRLAIAHYNGVSLWFPNTAAAPDVLDWKGSHLDIIVSRDGRFIVTSMQENALHGWRLSDKKNMRMTGYPAKTRALAWSPDGAWLATSGAEACILWPFRDKDGPMGKPPRECGVRNARVSCVAFHPTALVLALGYEDGWIMLVRLTDASEILVRQADRDGGGVSALAWDATGARLLFGTVGGAAGVVIIAE